jgi:hypothetical protein
MPVFVRTQEVEHPIGETGRFSLRLTSADTELRAADVQVARLRATYELRAGLDAEADEIFERAQLRISTGPSSLEAIEPDDFSSAIASLTRLFSAPGGLRKMRVEAEVPMGADLVFSGVSADATATGFSGVQQYQTVSGDLVLTGAAGSLRVKSVSGDVSIRAAGPVELEASAVSGDLSVAAPRFDRLSAGSVSGDIEIDGRLAPTASHRVETVSGDLGLGLDGDLTLEVRGLSTDVDIALPHRSQGSRDRRRYVVGNGGPALSFRSMSGDVSIRPSRRAPPATTARERSRTSPDVELEVLRALERGEIDVDEAARRLGRER